MQSGVCGDDNSSWKEATYATDVNYVTTAFECVGLSFESSGTCNWPALGSNCLLGSCVGCVSVALETDMGKISAE